MLSWRAPGFTDAAPIMAAFSRTQYFFTAATSKTHSNVLPQHLTYTVIRLDHQPDLAHLAFP
jgi:hypothetical protein